MKHKLIISILLTSLMLTACSLDVDKIDGQRPNNVQLLDKSDAQWQQHLAKIKKIQAYNNLGQLGYISSKERFSSRFEWQFQNPQNYTLKLYSTISATSLTLQMHNQVMTVSDNKGNQRSESDAKMLMRDLIGMDVPLEKLVNWLKGLPDERADYQVGANHYLASFSYPVDGTLWTADYLNYHQTEPALPRDILLKNHDQTLKIRVENWAF
ncbi:MAG: lipoprotein insertase outer membrane protein LolB [Pasteurellaceae bacterium]|nr:lipoprotein insertase outer membrane protein LolB [Pasteurellaceae bacterium]